MMQLRALKKNSKEKKLIQENRKVENLKLISDK